MIFEIGTAGQLRMVETYQTGGQGIAGQSVGGIGNLPSCNRFAILTSSASISNFVRYSERSQLKFFNFNFSSSFNDKPANCQRTVRNLKSS